MEVLLKSILESQPPSRISEMDLTACGVTDASAPALSELLVTSTSLSVVWRCRSTLYKPKSIPPGTERLKLKHDKMLSILLQFCFNFASILLHFLF